jgi:hypothetical protein
MKHPNLVSIKPAAAQSDVIGVQVIGHVLKAWERAAGGGRTAWRLFNATTFALARKVAEKPDLTQQPHTISDATYGGEQGNGRTQAWPLSVKDYFEPL